MRTTPGSISDTRLEVPGRVALEVARHGQPAAADVVRPQRLAAGYALSMAATTALA